MPPTEARPFDDAALLAAWERTRLLARPWKEVALLSAATGASAEELARLQVGERDRRLLLLRESVFGGRLECEASCPACGTRLEFELETASLRLPSGDVPESAFRISDGRTDVTFRLPDSADVAASSGPDRDPEEVLLSRCVLSATMNGAPVDGAALRPEVKERLSERMAELDPQADLRLDLSCPACRHAWRAGFDPAAFLLAEVDDRAGRLFAEVDVLARAYGWTEGEILALSPLRRRRYLEMALE